MKKSLFIIAGLVVALTSCASTNGLKKEKVDDGLIRYSDVVTETVRYEHPKLVPNADSGKFNLHKGADSENINAYIENNTFFIEAAYECKSPELIKINSIVFMSGDEKLEFKKTRVLPTDLDVNDYNYEQLINPYFSYSSVNNYSYEEFKMILSEDEVDDLSNLLEAGTVSVCFVGERGRTDLFKLNKKVTVALRTMIEKYDYLLYGEPEPDPAELEEETDYEEYALDNEDDFVEEETSEDIEATTDVEENTTEESETTEADGEVMDETVEETTEEATL